MPTRFTLPKVKKEKEWEFRVSPDEVQQYLKAGFKLAPRKRGGKCVLRKRKKPWEQFEEEVLLFARHGLKLEDVDGGPACRFAGNQLDVVGGLSDTFLIFECKSKKEMGKRSLRTDLKRFWVKKREVSSSLSKRFGNKYKHKKYIMVLRGITPSTRDLSYAKKKKIVVWPEAYYDSLRALYLMIGERVRYYVLRELGGVLPKVGEGPGSYFQFPAMAADYNGEALYAAFMPAKILLDLAYVLRIESGQKRAYQRFLDKSRLAKIAEFLKDGNTFKNSILIGLDKRSRFVVKTPVWARSASVRSRIGLLRIPRTFASAWVIDGQHRLYGYARSDRSLRNDLLPVVAMKAKSKADEAKAFIDINKNQKPVNPNLIWTLLGSLNPRSAEGVISELVKALNRQERGPFAGRIFVPGESKHSRKSYPIFHANFCQTISDHLVRGKKLGFGLLPDEEIGSAQKRSELIRKASNTLNLFFTELAWLAKRNGVAKWARAFFLTNNGVNVMCRVLAQILKFSDGSLDRNEFRKTFGGPIGAYLKERVADVDQTRRATSSEGTRDHEAFRFMAPIAIAVKGFAVAYMDSHRQKLQIDEPHKLLKELEQRLRETIREELSKITDSWWRQRVPGDVVANAETRKERHDKVWPWLETKDYPPICYVDFSDYSKIIARVDNWRDAFARIFNDKDGTLVRLRELDHIRNDIAHNRDLTGFQMDTLRFNCRYLHAAMDGYSVKKAMQLAASAGAEVA